MPSNMRDKKIAQRREYIKLRSESKESNEREYDYEGEMAKTQLRGIIRNANDLINMLEDNTNMAEWVQNKITKACDYIDTARDYMMNDVSEAIMTGSTGTGVSNMRTNDFQRQKTSTGIRVKKMVGGQTAFNKKREQLRALRNKVGENFMDGKNPQDKGDSKRHGINTKGSDSSLKKIRSSSSASPRKKQLAHWLLNMRKGRRKKAKS